MTSQTARVETIRLRIRMADRLSENDRLHWRTKARRTKTIRLIGHLTARGRTPMARADLVTRIGWPDRRQRDAHNLMPTLKAAIDGIVKDAGLLPDDNDRYLTGPDLRPYLLGEAGWVTIDLVFTEVSTADGSVAP